MIIGKYLIENLQPEIRNPKSAIQNPQFERSVPVLPKENLGSKGTAL